MEASAVKHASRRGLLGRRSPLLRLQGDERLIALIRGGHDRAFEVLFDRYHARLLAFCRHMLGSSEDAEDVLQEVFTNAHAAILADDRQINVRPWLYRIARNRCLNHLRKPVPESQDTMDIHPHDGGTTTAERVQKREDFRALVADVQHLPETQRTALLLREIDALSYDEISATMGTTVPAVKSLLVRARMSLAEATQSRMLSCGEVQLELAEAAEGLCKASGPVRHHVRSCEKCSEYRAKLRSNSRALAALAPPALLVWLHTAFGAKLFGLGSGAAGSGAAGTAAGAGVTGAAGATAGGGAAAAGGATLGGAAAAAGGAAGGLGGLIGAKAAAGIATAALITAGAVEVRHLSQKGDPVDGGTPATLENVPAPASTAPIAAFASLDEDDEEGEDEDEAARDEDDGERATGDGDGAGDESGEETSTDSHPTPTTSEEPSAPAEGTGDEAPESADGALGTARRGSGRRGGKGARGSGITDPGTVKPCEPPTDPAGPANPTDPAEPTEPTSPSPEPHPIAPDAVIPSSTASAAMSEPSPDSALAAQSS